MVKLKAGTVRKCNLPSVLACEECHHSAAAAQKTPPLLSAPAALGTAALLFARALGAFPLAALVREVQWHTRALRCAPPLCPARAHPPEHTRNEHICKQRGSKRNSLAIRHHHLPQAVLLGCVARCPGHRPLLPVLASFLARAGWILAYLVHRCHMVPSPVAHLYHRACL